MTHSMTTEKVMASTRLWRECERKKVLYPNIPHRYSFNNLRHPPVFFRHHKLIKKKKWLNTGTKTQRKKHRPIEEKKSRAHYSKRSMKETWLPRMILQCTSSLLKRMHVVDITSFHYYCEQWQTHNDSTISLVWPVTTCTE